MVIEGYRSFCGNYLSLLNQSCDFKSFQKIVVRETIKETRKGNNRVATYTNYLFLGLVSKTFEEENEFGWGTLYVAVLANPCSEL